MSIINRYSANNASCNTERSSLLIKNFEGWQLSLSKIDDVCQIELVDKWGTRINETILFVGSVSSDRIQDPSFLVQKKIKQLAQSESQLFGFQVYKKDGLYFVVFGDYGLKGGGKKEGLRSGIGYALLGAAMFLKGSKVLGGQGSKVLGSCYFAFGSSLIQYSVTTSEEEYDNDKAQQQAGAGFITGAFGQGISSFLKPVQGYELIKRMVGPIFSTFIQTLFLHGRAPNRNEMLTSVLVSGVGGLTYEGVSKAYYRPDATLVDKAIVGGLAGAASSGVSNALSNTLKGEKEADKHFGISATLGACSGAMQEVREEMDRREQLEIDLLKEIQKQQEEERARQEAVKKELTAEKSKLESKQTSLLNREQSLSQAANNALQKKQEALAVIDRKLGQKIENLLKQGFVLKNQQNTRASAVEQLAQGQQLTFHQYHRGKEVGKRSFKDESVKNQYDQAVSQWNSLQSDKTALQAEKANLHAEMESYNKKVPGTFTQVGQKAPESPLTPWEKKLQEVKPPVASASLKKMPPGETLLEAVRLMEAPYEPYPEKYLGKHLTGFTKIRSEKVGNWKMMLVKNNQTNECSVIFHGVLRALDSTAAGAIAHHIKNPTKLIREMGKVVDHWQQQGHSIASFYGHSHGGFFASHVKSSWKVRRVTMNGHNIHRGPLNINMRSEKDAVSQEPIGVKDRYITVVPGGHGIHNVVREIEKRNLQWSDILT